MSFIQILQVIASIIGIIISLGVLVAGAGYAYSQFFKGTAEKTNADYALLEKRITTLQKVCDDQQSELDGHQRDIRGLNQEIGRLKGINEEKDKKIKELENLLANRDPQMTEYIKSSIAFQALITNAVRDLGNVKSALDKVLEKISKP